MLAAHLLTSRSVSTGICTRSSGLICRQEGSGGGQAAQGRAKGGFQREQVGMDSSAVACPVAQQKDSAAQHS